MATNPFQIKLELRWKEPLFLCELSGVIRPGVLKEFGQLDRCVHIPKSRKYLMAVTVNNIIWLEANGWSKEDQEKMISRYELILEQGMVPR